MSKQSRSEKNDYLLELALEAQLDEDEEMKLYKDENINHEYIFSIDHEAKMKEIFKLAEKKDKMYQRKKLYMKTVASIAIILFLTSLTIANVEAFRIPFMNIFSEIKEKSSIFGVSNGNNIKLTKKFTDYEPTYVPQGFSVEFVKESDDTYMIQYVNEKLDQWYLLTFSLDAASVAMDTEDSVVEYFELNKRQFTKITKGNDKRIIMYMNTSQYEVVGNIDFDTILNILQSIH
ncbi:DUF4367 domain-containing protein [Lachnospiraceae bacterium 54-53]